MTKYEKLQNLLNEKQNISGLRRQCLRTSVAQLLSDGFTRTGSSGWISVRRGASKEIWTQEISDILNNLGIEHECGNDAPRGGANGEYVKVTSPAFVKVVKKVVAERKARWEAEKKEAAEKAAIAEAQRQAHHKRMNELVEENLDKFMAIDLLATMPDSTKRACTMFPESSARYLTKNQSKEVAKNVQEATGLDYQLCIWFVRGHHYADYMDSQLRK